MDGDHVGDRIERVFPILFLLKEELLCTPLFRDIPGDLDAGDDLP